jgi:outer membrane protein assembly factor BamB
MLAVALITASCGGDDAEPANDSANAGSGTAPTPTDIATTDIATTDIATTDIATTAPAESVSPTVAGGSSDRPGPMALCASPAAPQVIAFDRSDGAVRWVACGEASGFRYLEQVTDGIVYLLHVEQPDPNRYSAFDSASGRLLDDDAPAPPPPVGPTGEPGLPLTTVVDGITISGAQEGPTSAHDANGDELWTKPGRWVYDDVAAIDDGAVMALEITEQGPAQLVAYEIETGATRWAVSEEADSSPFALSPWVADGGQVVAGWSNVHVHHGADGALVWRTD